MFVIGIVIEIELFNALMTADLDIPIILNLKKMYNYDLLY